MASGNICYSLVWLILLVFLAWPIAMLISPIWIILLPFEAFCGIIADLNGFLERFVTWPRDLGSAIINCQTTCPQP